ncbi:hypothetical protein WG66_017049 [Moniliophthora roreri]|nr:hypothetical protein WG66_017049 [Moniliophthora roreri]
MRIVSSTGHGHQWQTIGGYSSLQTIRSHPRLERDGTVLGRYKTAIDGCSASFMIGKSRLQVFWLASGNFISWVPQSGYHCCLLKIPDGDGYYLTGPINCQEQARGVNAHEVHNAVLS